MDQDLPVLTTARLTLRIAGPSDAERCVRFSRENADFLKPWEPPLVPALLDPDAVREMRVKAVNQARSGTAYSFAIFPGSGDEDVPIAGWVEFTNVVRGVFQSCAMGYKLDRMMQGHGYMTEATRAGIDYLFNEQHLHRVSAAYMPHNQRSAAVLRRLGFSIEGTAKSYLFINGQWRDHVLTSLINAREAPPPGYVLDDE
ncbi:MAG: GNAT family N-acetyltransferase [Candidatus Eremiobacteraeota bacterium]|nr:GNAT family N-acetyltransferase [Candidatus Eremiobacteraeota bacterium]